jgi:hypothetical protein
MAFANSYSAGMAFEKIFRVSALLAALVLAVGFTMHGLGASDMIVKSAMTAASDMPMPIAGKCSGCAGDDKGEAPTICSACCSAVLALPLVAVVLDAVRSERVNPMPGPDIAGHANPPDPYPPRPIILS